MQVLRFTLAFAEMLLSPAILLYLVVGPKAMRMRAAPPTRLHSGGGYAAGAQF